MSRKKLIIFFVLLLQTLSYSQESNGIKYITVIPGEQYEASGFYQFWFGQHWREVWTTPVKVEILNFNTFAGGLTPIERGGGMQTKSLRFKGNDGKIWKFRTIEKDPSKVLPEELRESVAEQIVRDQISSANPFAPLVVSPLLDAVGIFEARPQLVFLPSDEKLGEFKDEFGDKLGFIEEHPTEGKDDQSGFDNALDVKGTYKLFDHLAEKRKQKIDEVEYLKARLIDILIGDWDRHMDQWRWAKFDSLAKGNEFEVWKPIPRDRDQAFSKYDGIFPYIAAYIVPQLNNFGNEYPQMEDLTWNGRFLDRRALTELSKATWDSVMNYVKRKITDEVIDSAIDRLPPEIKPKCSTELKTKLKSRKDHLEEASNEFYVIVNKYADVFCSNEDDFVEINRIDDTSTTVSIFKRDKSTGNGEGEPLFFKMFDNNVTVDLRVHLNDGDDKAIVFGECSVSPIVRIIGGEGKDEFIDESIVKGYFLSVTPFPATKDKTYFYDSGNKTEVKEGDGTTYDNSKWPEPESDQEKYEPHHRDRGHDWILIPIIDFNSDYGLVFGGGIRLNQFNFRTIPQDYMQQVSISYATRFGNIAAAYEADFYSVLRSGRLNLLVGVTQQFVTRYFGYGNETSYNKNLDAENYYQANQNLLTFFPTMFYNFSKNILGSIGISFIQTKTALNNDTLLAGFRYGNYGLGVIKPFGIHLNFEVDGKDHPQYPLNGYWISLYGKIFPDVYDIPEMFYFAGFDLRTYLTAKSISFATLALRAGGSKVFSKYPFYAGATIGGQHSLRGYNEKRFSGDAAVFGQAEVRLFITNLNLILRSKVGINFFVEAGRVFATNEISEKWHPSYGAGLWISYLNSTLIGNTYIAFSPETTIFNLGFGMGF